MDDAPPPFGLVPTDELCSACYNEHPEPRGNRRYRCIHLQSLRCVSFLTRGSQRNAESEAFDWSACVAGRPRVGTEPW